MPRSDKVSIRSSIIKVPAFDQNKFNTKIVQMVWTISVVIVILICGSFLFSSSNEKVKNKQRKRFLEINFISRQIYLRSYKNIN